MKSFLAAALLSLSTSIHADVTGPWIGWVYWGFQGSSTKCDAQLKVTETATALNRTGGLIDCGAAYMEMPEMVLTKSADKLIHENEEVGTWKENYFQWTERYDENVQIKVELSVEANHMDYHEQWIHNDGSLIYDLKGRFFRK